VILTCNPWWQSASLFLFPFIAKLACAEAKGALPNNLGWPKSLIRKIEIDHAVAPKRLDFGKWRALSPVTLLCSVLGVGRLV
jgi:hypothetical protein